jgi:hypothetical protein
VVEVDTAKVWTKSRGRGGMHHARLSELQDAVETRDMQVVAAPPGYMDEPHRAVPISRAYGAGLRGLAAQSAQRVSGLAAPLASLPPRPPSTQRSRRYPRSASRPPPPCCSPRSPSSRASPCHGRAAPLAASRACQGRCSRSKGEETCPLTRGVHSSIIHISIKIYLNAAVWQNYYVKPPYGVI